MDKVNVTLSLFFEIKDAEIYGGYGTIGYSESKIDFTSEKHLSINIEEYAKKQISGFSNLFNVPIENIRIIPRNEYESNTDND